MGKEKVSTFAPDFERNADGSVAQLNRASDYGSEGSRFESWRSHHQKREGISLLSLFFLARKNAISLITTPLASHGKGGFLEKDEEQTKNRRRTALVAPYHLPAIYLPFACHRAGEAQLFFVVSEKVRIFAPHI